jgi:signal recognition particle subunit SRP54
MFDSLSEKLTAAAKRLKGQHKITETNIEDTLKEVRTALLEADVNFRVVKKFLEQVKAKALGQQVIKGVNPGEQFIKILHDELTSMMGGSHPQWPPQVPGPLPIIIVGLNGAGKTTFCGKLALFLRTKLKKEVLLVPADNFRPAAKEQLITHAKNLGVDYFDSDLSKTPKQIVEAAMLEAKKLHKNYVIIDTAGRQQVDEELMGQLQDVKRFINDTEKQSEVIMVVDAMTGQEAVVVAKAFHERVNLTGVVLSKMDSDTRGGAALSIRHDVDVPILFMSQGEKLKELDLFHPERMAGRILDMGDVMSLVEKAQENIDEKDAEKMMHKMQKGQFTISDFLKQMESIQKMGSMQSIMKMIPGMGGIMKQVGDLSGAEGELDNMKVMINSMTKAERENHKLLNTSRRERIAKGSGRKVEELNQFLTRFEQMQKMMSGLMGMMGGGGGMGALGGMMGMGGHNPNLPPGFAQRPGFRQAKATQEGQDQQVKSKGKKKGPFSSRFF